jgi:hypothetical protein
MKTRQQRRRLENLIFRHTLKPGPPPQDPNIPNMF